MRQFLLTRGVPGSGKSTFLKESGLWEYTVSPDSLRLLFDSPRLNQDGSFSISQQHSIQKKVFNFVENILEERFENGITTVYDATNLKQKSFNKYISLARKYNYRVAILDFTQRFTLDQCVQNDHNRSHPYKTGENVVKSKFQQIENIDSVNADVIIMHQNNEINKKNIHDWLKKSCPIFDVNQYKRTHIFGDLQGCWTVVQQYLNQFTGEFNDDEFYVFIGDLLDRGIENHLVMQNMLKLVNKPNVKIIRGNHELHIENWINNNPIYSKEFLENTVPQLDSVGFTKQQAYSILRNSYSAFYLNAYGKTYVLSHAGLPSLPQYLYLLPDADLLKGFGTYETNIDEMFHNDHGIIQIHGHRNIKKLPGFAGNMSINLEANVDRGGFLRVLQLSHHESKIVEIKNEIFKNSDSMKSQSHPQQNHQQISKSIMSNETFNALQSSSDITEKKFDDVSSFLFKRKIFNKSSWNSLNVKARGLFVNNKTKEIVARSYDKFFNVGENNLTDVDYLADTFAYPVTTYIKENGFLGIIGVHNDELFITSKSNPTSSFALLFKNIFHSLNLDEKNIKKYLVENQSSLVFEVIDPVNDPHIIEYDKQKLILLDVVKRQEKFQKLNYDQLYKFGKQFNLEIKKCGNTIFNPEHFRSYLNNIKAQDINYKLYNVHHEGLVLEDTNLLMTKLKFPYYSFWKYMRSKKDLILKSKLNNEKFEIYKHSKNNNQKLILEWMTSLTVDILQKDIITVRKYYELENQVIY